MNLRDWPLGLCQTSGRGTGLRSFIGTFYTDRILRHLDSEDNEGPAAAPSTTGAIRAALDANRAIQARLQQSLGLIDSALQRNADMSARLHQLQAKKRLAAARCGVAPEARVRIHMRGAARCVNCSQP